jgi:tripartite-type tricarboxylate transporter receptor subunit TctC
LQSAASDEKIAQAGAQEEIMCHQLQIANAAVALACIALVSLHGRPSQAQDFSDKPIRMIVGVAAGGATDLTARLVAQKLTASLHTNVYVENKPGAAFEPVYRELTAAPPDGHTLVMISASAVITQPAHKNYPFDMRKMTPITEVSEGPFILTARKSLGFKNVNDLVAYGRAHPNTLTFGSGGGPGSSLTLTAELFRLSAGITIINVPYKGAAPALNDLLGNHIDAMFDAIPLEVAQVKAGNVSGIAVTSATRSSALPEVPTMVESGFKDFVVANYFGLITTPNTPPAIVQKLHDEVAKAVALPDVIALFKTQGMEPVANQPAEFEALIKSDLARWTKVMKDAGIEPQ